MAEICKMVERDSTQQAKLLRNSNDYAVCMDSAVYKMKDREEAAKFIFWIKKTFNPNFVSGKYYLTIFIHKTLLLW